MKKFAILLALLVAIFSIGACGETPADPPSQSPSTCLHDWTSATCEIPQTCQLCGNTDGVPLGHVPITDSAIAPTCEEPGLSEGSHCSRCNKILTSQIVIPKIDHSYEESIELDATCVQDGTKIFTCNSCYDSYTESFSLQSYTAEEIYSYAKDSAVEILTYDRTGDALAIGSGFVYSANGRIVTNYHVIEDAYYADVYVGETPYEVVSVLAYDIDRDIAVLKINARNLQTLKVCTQPVKTGATVYALGSSRGLTSTFSRGIITTASREMDGVTYIQHDAAISNGNSGGPLLNEYNEIIGINTLTIKDSQNLNFAIFTSELDNLVYGSPLTLPELYEKECNPFLKLKNYVVNNYDSVTSEYYMLRIGKSSYNGYTYTRGIFYYPDEDELEIAMSTSTYLITVEICEGEIKYNWSLYDSSTSYIMQGYLYPSIFSKDSTYLSYTSTNISYSSLKKSFNELAVAEVRLLCTFLNTDLAFLNISAFNLGFVNF